MRKKKRIDAVSEILKKLANMKFVIVDFRDLRMCLVDLVGVENGRSERVQVPVAPRRKLEVENAIGIGSATAE